MVLSKTTMFIFTLFFCSIIQLQGRRIDVQPAKPKLQLEKILKPIICPQDVGCRYNPKTGKTEIFSICRKDLCTKHKCPKQKKCVVMLLGCVPVCIRDQKRQ
uniref:Uncharacterized protein n=1 Tax=Clytia hemisphaerica TaxID=252671 RepID=A0A7M5TUP8_9CNID|eukprot:TCONS_00058544-protein